MGTARSWREMQAAWRESTARKGTARESLLGDGWNGPRELAQLEEFDWNSLRRAWDDGGDEQPVVESHEERAARSLALVDATIAADRRRRRWLQLAGVVLAPLLLVLAYRSAREAFA